MLAGNVYPRAFLFYLFNMCVSVYAVSFRPTRHLRLDDSITTLWDLVFPLPSPRLPPRPREGYSACHPLRLSPGRLQHKHENLDDPAQPVRDAAQDPAEEDEQLDAP